MKKYRGLLVLFLAAMLLLTGCQELFPQKRSYINVKVCMNISMLSLTDEEQTALCELLMNEPLLEISAEEAAAREAGIYGFGTTVEFTCGLKHYKWYIRGSTVSCTIKPLVGKETAVYYQSDTLSDKVYDFLKEHDHGGIEE